MSLLGFLFGSKFVKKTKQHTPKVWRELGRTFLFVESINNTQESYYVKSQYCFKPSTKGHIIKELLVKEYDLFGDTRNTNIKGMKKRLTTIKYLSLKASHTQLQNLGIL